MLSHPLMSRLDKNGISDPFGLSSHVLSLCLLPSPSAQGIREKARYEAQIPFQEESSLQKEARAIPNAPAPSQLNA